MYDALWTGTDARLFPFLQIYELIRNQLENFAGPKLVPIAVSNEKFPSENNIQE